MKLFYLLITCLLLTACSTPEKQVDQGTFHPAVATPAKKQATQTTTPPKKNPIAVTLYTHGKKPSKPYTIVGHETVSKYNLVGMKRQEAHIRDVMRNLAANMGGDAVIDISHDDKTVQATVIAYHDDANKTSKV